MDVCFCLDLIFTPYTAIRKFRLNRFQFVDNAEFQLLTNLIVDNTSLEEVELLGYNDDLPFSECFAEQAIHMLGTRQKPLKRFVISELSPYMEQMIQNSVAKNLRTPF